MNFVVNLPHIQCWIKKEFLYDFKKGFGEYVPCTWVTLKSIPRRAFYIESYLPEYGALYDKLPISAYVWKTDIDLDKQLPLDFLQLWDGFSYHITVIEKQYLQHSRVEIILRDGSRMGGEYLFTVDSAHADPNIPNVTESEVPTEHKSHNIGKLDNGQWFAQPNNRMLFFESSVNKAKGLNVPDFKVSSKYYHCEQNPKWVFGDSDEYFYPSYEVNKKPTKNDN
jgi:hypothetical protein